MKYSELTCGEFYAVPVTGYNHRLVILFEGQSFDGANLTRYMHLVNAKGEYHFGRIGISLDDWEPATQQERHELISNLPHEYDAIYKKHIKKEVSYDVW